MYSPANLIFSICLFAPSVKFRETDDRIKECKLRPNELLVNLIGLSPDSAAFPPFPKLYDSQSGCCEAICVSMLYESHTRRRTLVHTHSAVTRASRGYGVRSYAPPCAKLFREDNKTHPISGLNPLLCFIPHTRTLTHTHTDTHTLRQTDTHTHTSNEMYSGFSAKESKPIKDTQHY